tara:strand:+ start:32 stop:781 length:750 start_codon:yes stop_codon:yes gene_type:complete
MALQSSGAISLANIQTEFGGSNPISMNEYYRGGGLVPSSVTAVPASGTIDMADFYGTSNVSPMSTSNFMRINSSSLTVYSNQQLTGGIVFGAGGGVYIRMRRADPYVYLEVKERVSGYSSQYWNTSGTSNTLSTSYVTMGRFNLTGITAIKMNWSTVTSTGTGFGAVTGNTSGASATYSASDNTFQSVSNNQSIGLQFQATVSAECYASNVGTFTITLDATAQKSGYSDTSIGTYRIQVRGAATSTACF